MILRTTGEQLWQWRSPCLGSMSRPRRNLGSWARHGLQQLDGGMLKLNFEDSNFKAKYYDEYTGKDLPRHLVIEAMVEELSYFNDKEVWKATSRKAAKINEGGTHVRMRWVLCNKGDEAHPDVRARLVACEVAKDQQPSFFASTPPLEAKRLCSTATPMSEPVTMSRS